MVASVGLIFFSLNYFSIFVINSVGGAGTGNPSTKKIGVDFLLKNGSNDLLGVTFCEKE